MGVPARPQVLAMAALKVAMSAFVVPLVAPGAAESPSQLVIVDQFPSTVEPPSHI